MSQAAPIPFIQWKDEGFVVEEAAAKVLSQIKGKISVIVVAGPYRTGKSYLLNRLIGHDHQQGFQVGGTIRACTKGIWLWGEPIKTKDTTYVFLDSEGLGSLEQEQTFDTQIFSLALLLSSLFVLNTQGTINEAALEQLELVVECTKKIRVSDSDNKESSDLAEYFPSFLWVLRDFVLELQDNNGNPITSKQYLEQALTPQSGSRAASKNRIRQAITSVFANRDCVTLVRPVLDERQLQRLPSIAAKDLRPEFRSQMEELRAKVFRAAKPKTLSGSLVSGPALVSLARVYAKAINTGAVPTIHSAWQSVVAIQAREALDNAVALFTKGLKKAFKADSVLEEGEVHELMRTLEAQALGSLQERMIGDEPLLRNLADQLQNKMRELSGQHAESNALRSAELCRRVVEELWEKRQMDSELSSVSGASDLNRLREAFVQAFLKQAKGPAKEQVVREFVEKKWSAVMKRVFERCNELQKKLEAAQTSLQQIQKQLKEEQDKGNKQSVAMHKLEIELKHQQELTTKLESRVASEERRLAELTEQHAQINSALKQANKANKKLESECEALKATVKEKEQAVKALEKQVRSGEKKHESLEKQMTELLKTYEQTGQENENKERQLLGQISQAKQQIDKYEKLLHQAQAAHDSMKSQLQQSQGQVQQAQAAHDALAAQLKQAQSQGESGVRELQKLQEAAKKEVTARDKALSQLKEQLDQSLQDKEKLTKKLNKAKAQHEQQSQQYVQQIEQLEEQLREQAGSSGAAAALLQARVEALSAEVSALRAEEKRLRAEAKARDEADNKRNKGDAKAKEDAEKKLKAAEKELKRKEKEVQEKEAELEQKAREIEGLEKEVESMGQELTQVSKQLVQETSEHKQTQKDLAKEINAHRQTKLSLEKKAPASSVSSSSFSSSLGEPELIADASSKKPKRKHHLPEPKPEQFDRRRSTIPDRDFDLRRASLDSLPSSSSARRQSDFTMEAFVDDDSDADAAPFASVRGKSSTKSSAKSSKKKSKSRKEEKEDSDMEEMEPGAEPEEEEEEEELPADPSTLNVQQLMSRLTALNVKLPVKKEKKQFYLDLLYKHDPRLQGAEAASSSKKRTSRKR